MSRANDYRKRKSEIEPTTELTLPSGAVWTMRRPPMEVWITAGKIPQSFLTLMLKSQHEGAMDMSDDETLAAMAFLRDAIVYACVNPQLVVGATSDDELDPSELDPEDFEFLTRWVNTGCPGVPVRTKAGEVLVEDLARFRQKRPGGRPFSLEPDGEQIPPEAERDAGAA